MADEATTLEVPLEIPSEVNSGDDRFIRRFLWAPYLAIGAILVALAIASFLEYRQKTKAQRDKTSNAHPFFSSNKSRYKVTMNKDGPPRTKTPDALPSVSQLIDVYYQKGKPPYLKNCNLSSFPSPRVAFLYRHSNPLPEKTGNGGSRSSPDSAVDITNNVSSEESQTPSTNCDYVPLILKHGTSNVNHQGKTTIDRHVSEADISIAVAENRQRIKQQYTNNMDYVSTITDDKHRSQLSLGVVKYKSQLPVGEVNNYRSQLPVGVVEKYRSQLTVGVVDGIHHPVGLNSGSISQKIGSKEPMPLSPTHPYDKPLHIYTDDDLYSLSNSNHLNKMQHIDKCSIPTLGHPTFQIRKFPTHLLNDVAMERQQYGCYLENFHTNAAPSRQQNFNHSRILELDAHRLNENEYQKDHHFDGRNYSNNENARSIPNHNVNDYDDTDDQVSRKNSPADDPFPRKDAKCFINITLL